MTRVLLLDDHALIEEILTESISAREPNSSLLTTCYWYYRACRGAVLGAGGQLSGPFEQLVDASFNQLIIFTKPKRAYPFRARSLVGLRGTRIQSVCWRFKTQGFDLLNAK